MPLCGPWVDAEDLTLCAGDDIDPGVLADAAVAATELLYALSGRQYGGVCTDTVRPCRAGPSWLYPSHLGGWWRDGWWQGEQWQPPRGCHCTTGPGCGCSHDAVPLPRTPVVDVTEVVVDGQVVDPAGDGWVIVDDRWLVRRGPDRWPSTQLLDRPATDEGTWQVTYLYGVAPPAAGMLAAEVLACELARAWSGMPCKLPRRVTSINAENVQMQFAQVDSQAFFAAGRLGLYEVDAFLAAENPHRLQRRGRVLSPRRRRHHRVRVPATVGGNIYSGGTPTTTGDDIYDAGTPTTTGDDIYSGGPP